MMRIKQVLYIMLLVVLISEAAPVAELVIKKEYL